MILRMYLYAVTFLFVLFGIGLSAQNITSVRYSFDNCDLNESNGILPGGQIAGDPTCTCGLSGNSFYFDGNDTLYFPPELSDLFISESFTLDFYFTVEDTNGEMDIFSSSARCVNSDSTIYLKYLGSIDELFFVFGSNINNRMLVRSPVDKTLCWQRFTLVKSRTEYFYYINNKLVQRFVSRENIPISRSFPLAFGYNICGVQGSEAFRGQVDEITWINRALSPFEINLSYLFPDQIVTRDTTIFLGGSVNIVTGNTCAPSVSWNPTAGLDLSSPFAPVAQPEQTTTYFSEMNYRHCTIRDSVRIYVVDKEDLECDKILLPKAFTPNGDGLNDRYGISNLFILESFAFLEVLDRSGAVLWRTEESGSEWDGTFRGSPSNSGVYFYKVKYTCGGKEYLKIDSFSLLR